MSEQCEGCGERRFHAEGCEVARLQKRVAELEAELKSARKSMFRALNDREQLKADNSRLKRLNQISTTKYWKHEAERLRTALQEIASAANYTAPEDVEARLANEVQVYAIARQALGDDDD